MFAFTPIAFMIMRGVVQGISPSMEEAAQTLRASRLKTFTTVTLPLMKPGLANAFLVGFIESIADFGNPIIVGGQYAVLSTDIFFAIVGAQYDQGKAASLALMFTKGLNLGVDFVGGQMIRVTFVQTPEAPVGELRETVGKLGYGEPIIQQFGKPNAVSIRMKLPEGSDVNVGLANEMTSKITTTIKAAHPDARIDGIDSVSGKVSGELFKTGMQALLAAMVAISLYIWIRFEWQFGVGALFALVHDVTLTLGLFALTQMEFDLNIVAAILTLIGYSLNDTIVVYDR